METLRWGSLIEMPFKAARLGIIRHFQLKWSLEKRREISEINSLPVEKMKKNKLNE